MKTDRATARIVGILYIIGTLAGVVSVFVMGTFSTSSDLLNAVNANPHRVEFGAFLMLVMGLPLAMIAVLMFPILKRQNEALAIGYVVFRGALEQIFYFGTAICWLVLVIDARHYADSGAADSSHYHVLGNLVFNAVDPIQAFGSIVFSLGALILYSLFYQAKLIPQWISVFGFVCVVGYFVAGVSAVFGTTRDLLMMPMLLQEMIMAVWLIVRGFNPGTILSDVDLQQRRNKIEANERTDREYHQ